MCMRACSRMCVCVCCVVVCAQQSMPRGAIWCRSVVLPCYALCPTTSNLQSKNREIFGGSTQAHSWLWRGDSHQYQKFSRARTTSRTDSGSGVAPFLPPTILYYTILYCTVLYCTVLYCTIYYDTIRRLPRTEERPAQLHAAEAW